LAPRRGLADDARSSSRFASASIILACSLERSTRLLDLNSGDRRAHLIEDGRNLLFVDGSRVASRSPALALLNCVV